MAKIRDPQGRFFAAGEHRMDDIRIACYADLHGKLPEPPNGMTIMVAGDALSYGRVGFPKEEDADFSRWARTRRVLAVKGNHDCPPNSLYWSEDVTGRCLQVVPGISVVGIGWAGRDFFDLPREMDMEPVCNAASSMALRQRLLAKSPDKLIVLTHYPPLLDSVLKFSGNPAGWAFRCIASMIDILKPVAVVAGHVHELAGKVAEYKGPGLKSLIVFPGQQGGVLYVNAKSNGARFETFPVMSSALERPSGLGFGISS